MIAFYTVCRQHSITSDCSCPIRFLSDARVCASHSNYIMTHFDRFRLSNLVKPCSILRTCHVTHEMCALTSLTELGCARVYVRTAHLTQFWRSLWRRYDFGLRSIDYEILTLESSTPHFQKGITIKEMKWISMNHGKYINILNSVNSCTHAKEFHRISSRYLPFWNIPT